MQIVLAASESTVRPESGICRSVLRVWWRGRGNIAGRRDPAQCYRVGSRAGHRHRDRYRRRLVWPGHVRAKQRPHGRRCHPHADRRGRDHGRQSRPLAGRGAIPCVRSGIGKGKSRPVAQAGQRGHELPGVKGRGTKTPAGKGLRCIATHRQIARSPRHEPEQSHRVMSR